MDGGRSVPLVADELPKFKLRNDLGQSDHVDEFLQPFPLPRV